jgi:hypothetical protein
MPQCSLYVLMSQGRGEREDCRGKGAWDAGTLRKKLVRRTIIAIAHDSET